MKKNLVTGLVLGIFALICALLLSFVNFLTEDTINERTEDEINSSLATLSGCSSLDEFNSMYTTDTSIDHNKEDGVVNTYIIRNGDGEAVYAIYLIDQKGYASTIETMVSIKLNENNESVVYDYKVISQSETKGNVINHSATNSGDGFNMKGESDLSEFEGLAGSTYSSNAIYRTFNIALHFGQIDLGGNSND